MSPKALEALSQALTDLRRDPSQSVRLRVDDLDVELRVLAEGAHVRSAADLFRDIGPWEGETTEELLELLAEGRRRGSSRTVAGL